MPIKGLLMDYNTKLVFPGGVLATVTADREMIFVSHANPEDNEFSRWLTLQLAVDGYPVWCDLTQFLGGEHFWENAEDAIRTRTIKFLYFLSRTSNHKEGPRNELHIAKNVQRSNSGLKDFIIPLHVDDLPYGEINVQLTSQIAISFENSWAAGYDQLLQRLETDKVAKKPGFNPQAVASWWRTQFSPLRGLVQKNDRHVSNWLKVRSLPDRLYFHGVKRNGVGLMELKARPPFPAFLDSFELVTFAPAESFDGRLAEFSVVSSRHIETSVITNDRGELSYEAHNQLRNLLTRLLKECWNDWMAGKGLGQFELADKGLCFYFKKPNEADQLSIGFVDSDGKQHRPRGVVGFRSRLDHTKRFWHFGVQARPIFRPFTAFSLSSHVVFPTMVGPSGPT